jgi:hypothetical protein
MGRLSPADFLTVYGFRRPEVDLSGGFTPGLRSGLSLHHPPEELRSLGAARLVSTPSRLCLSGLGSGLPFKVSPNLSSSASPVSQTSTQVFLKSAAYAIPPRPRAAVLLHFYHRADLPGFTRPSPKGDMGSSRNVYRTRHLGNIDALVEHASRARKDR